MLWRPSYPRSAYFAVVALTLILAGLVVLRFASPAPEPVPTGDATSTPSRTDTFTHSYLAGFEGVNYRVTAEFEYPFPQFTTMKDELADSQFMLHEGERIHWFYIMLNDGAGFASPDEAFESNWRSRLCEACVKSADPFPVSAIRGATSLGTYEDADTRVLVWGYGNAFYVAARLMKPAEAAQEVIRTFRLSFPRTDEELPYQR